MQAASDIFLGWLREPRGLEDLNLRDLYVRQLWDSKTSPDVAAMQPSDMALYARLCGFTLARAHARSGDAVAIASYLGTSELVDRAIAAFAETYADQNERDHAALLHAIATGRIRPRANRDAAAATVAARTQDSTTTTDDRRSPQPSAMVWIAPFRRLSEAADYSDSMTGRDQCVTKLEGPFTVAPVPWQRSCGAWQSYGSQPS